MFEVTEIQRLFPIISGEIKLRLFCEDDISDSYVNWLNDPELMKYSNQRFRAHSIATCLEYFHTFEGSSSIFLAVVTRGGGQVFGTMTIHCIPEHETADVGILIAKKYCGKGIGKIAWRTVLELLSNDACVRKVTGGTLSCNFGMIKIMKDTGMQEDGVRRAQELVDGQAHDLLHFSKFK
jgi:[ribosomal protein S5]-alanine N-acetyltransferase